MKIFLVYMEYLLFYLWVCSNLSSSSSVVNDVSLTYSNEGSILQYDYAGKAVERCPAVIGFVDLATKNGVIIRKATKMSPLQQLPTGRSVDQISIQNDQIAVVSTGHPPDVTLLSKQINQWASSHTLTYGEVIPDSILTDSISEFLTQSIGQQRSSRKGTEESDEAPVSRPIACSGLVLGWRRIREAERESPGPSSDGWKVYLKKFEHTGGVSGDTLFAYLGNLSKYQQDALQRILSPGDMEAGSFAERVSRAAALLLNGYDTDSDIHTQVLDGQPDRELADDCGGVDVVISMKKEYSVRYIGNFQTKEDIRRALKSYL